jgi:hypothetical protein
MLDRVAARSHRCHRHRPHGRIVDGSHPVRFISRQQFGNEAVIPATVGLRFSSKTIGPRLPVSVGGVWRSLIEMRLGPIDEEVSACASQPTQSTPPAPA